MKKKILILENKEAGRSLTDAASRIAPDVQSVATSQGLLEQARRFNPDLILLDTNHQPGRPFLQDRQLLGTLKETGNTFLVVSDRRDPEAIMEAQSMGASDFICRPFHLREFILRLSASLQRKQRIVCLGGGTGLFTLLMGLKRIPNALLTSIVSMSDDGGSSGRLRASFGILPPGDIRRSLVALSNAPEVMNELIQYRFKKGKELEDHSLGNLLLTALSEIKGGMPEAVKALGDILNIQGVVLPVTTTLTDLVAEFEDGTIVRGESKIDQGMGRNPNLRIVNFNHEPHPESNPDAYAALVFADLITIGPGDLFTSIIANVSISKIRDAISKSRAKKIYFCNVMTKPGETSHYTVADHVKEIIRYLGGDFLDYVFLSDTKFTDDSLQEYALKGQGPVLTDLAEAAAARITKARFISADLAHQNELVRHDSDKIRIHIEKLLEELSVIREPLD